MPDLIAAEIAEDLRAALKQFEEIMNELNASEMKASVVKAPPIPRPSCALL